ncbi:MAG: hypothetical protein E7031_03800 [Akkermansiaceae bacterium]|nr:hypothetical protein [Akkermansiaceae bacterium]
MKYSTLLLTLASAPALIFTAEAAKAPKSLADFQFPIGNEQALCCMVQPAFTKELAAMHAAALQKLGTLEQSKVEEFRKNYNPDMPMPYIAEMWESEAAYKAYVAEWDKRERIENKEVPVLISLSATTDQKWQLLASAVNPQTNQQMPLPQCTLKYDATTDTWSSVHGELTPADFEADENYVYRAQKGKEWKLEKKDSMTQTSMMLRIAKTKDGKAVFISYISMERSQISGQVLSQQGYTLYYPISEKKSKKR